MKEYKIVKYEFDLDDMVLVPGGFVWHENRGKVGRVVGFDGNWVIIKEWRYPYKEESNDYFIWDKGGLRPYKHPVGNKR